MNAATLLRRLRAARMHVTLDGMRTAATVWMNGIPLRDFGCRRHAIEFAATLVAWPAKRSK